MVDPFLSELTMVVVGQGGGAITYQFQPNAQPDPVPVPPPVVVPVPERRRNPAPVLLPSAGLAVAYVLLRMAPRLIAAYQAAGFAALNAQIGARASLAFGF
jgi:hypothetical protein